MIKLRELLNKEGMELTSGPFHDLFHLLIGSYLQNILGVKRVWNFYLISPSLFRTRWKRIQGCVWPVVTHTFTKSMTSRMPACSGVVLVLYEGYRPGWQV